MSTKSNNCCKSIVFFQFCTPKTPLLEIKHLCTSYPKQTKVKCYLCTQVAKYCSERMHMALVEELELLKDDMVDDSLRDTRHMQWERVFTSCFLKVDDEVGGKVSRSSPTYTPDPVAPETVGSTAVVVVICSSHIIVANCGDSRAVLYRGKEAIALSVDHKVRDGL